MMDVGCLRLLGLMVLALAVAAVGLVAVLT